MQQQIKLHPGCATLLNLPQRCTICTVPCGTALKQRAFPCKAVITTRCWSGLLCRQDISTLDHLQESPSILALAQQTMPEFTMCVSLPKSKVRKTETDSCCYVQRSCWPQKPVEAAATELK